MTINDELPITLPIPLHQEIRNILLNALAYTDGHQRKAALLLGISPTVMSRKMDKYRIPHLQVREIVLPSQRDRALAKLTPTDKRILGIEVIEESCAHT